MHQLSSQYKDALATEWQRVGMLAQCLAANRQGHDVGQEDLDRLRQLQELVEKGRLNGSWSRLVSVSLSPLEFDVLACVLAPEVEPRLGWLYQSLQPGVSHPYATPALLHDLLALESSEMGDLYQVLDHSGRLHTSRLIEYDRLETFQPVKPFPGVAALLLGHGQEPDPPGATRVVSDAGWEDLVLPPQRLAMLHEFLHWVRQRETVVKKWGGKDVGGPVALFTGPSGTGKTLAAAILANDLDWPLYKVDLGTLVSKYIGETEKNLNRLFDAADGRNVVLQFDEADSLFGKRGEIREARDRYANLEVSHLLARLENHHGPCILTTNLRSNLDPAFVRRFQVVVEFSRPDEKARVELWRRLLPPRAPGRKALDMRLLGRSVHLTGAEIRNASLHAAHLAAAEGSDLRYEHLALSAWRELSKSGRERSPSDLGELQPYLGKESIR